MRGYCYRNPGDPNVYTEAGEKRENFEKMKQQYIEEGRVLAALGEQPGVVNVYTFIEENNTAYLVMDFVEGRVAGCICERSGRQVICVPRLWQSCVRLSVRWRVYINEV